MAVKKKCVLVVDDESAVRDLIKVLLSQTGFVVETAESGVEALGKLEWLDCDLVLTDLLMPGMMGDQLAQEIKKRRPGLPVVLVTGQLVGSMVPDIDRVLAKPFSKAELRDAVLEMIELQPSTRHSSS